MIYVCVYIYNIYRYIHTRTYINMYTFTARGDNARVISRNRYIKVCSCRRTRSIASEFAGWIATSARGQSSRASSDIICQFFSAKVMATDRIHSFLPFLRTDRKARIGSTTAACSSREKKILSKYRAGRPVTCAYIYYTAMSYVYFSLWSRVRPTSHIRFPLPSAHVCVYIRIIKR